MKNYTFLILCIALHLYAADKKSMGAAAGDKRLGSTGGYVHYNPKPIFVSPNDCRMVRFLPDGEHIVADPGHRLAFYDVKEKKKSSFSHQGAIYSFDCQNHVLAAIVQGISEENGIHVWNLESSHVENPQSSWEASVDKKPTIKLAPKGEKLAVTNNGTISIYSLGGELSAHSTNDNTKIDDMVWLPDNNTLAYYKRDRKTQESSIALWDTREKKESATIQMDGLCHWGSSHIACSANGTLMWAEMDVIRVWDKRTQKTRDMALLSNRERLLSNVNYYTSLALSHDDTTLAALLLCRRCELIDWCTGKIVQSLPVDTEFNHHVALSAKSDKVAIASINQNQWKSQISGIRVYEKEKRSENTSQDSWNSCLLS